MDIRIGGRYKLKKKIGQGAFGDIFSAENLRTSEPVVVKLENIEARHPQLQYEYQIYKLLHQTEGVPKAHSFFQEGDFNVMVMDPLGPSLESLFNFCGRKFTEQTVALIGIQCLKRIESLHQKGFTHRDINPENFLIGIGRKEDLIYLIDYGLSKRYKDPITGEHISFKTNRRVTGTARFQSVNASLGNEQSRRDDLVALCYMLAYFLRGGSLPWIKAERNQDGTINMKQVCHYKDLASSGFIFEGCSSEFVAILNYCKEIPFSTRPHYDYIKGLFLKMFRTNGWSKQEDLDYDWFLRRDELLQTTFTLPVIHQQPTIIHLNHAEPDDAHDLYNSYTLIMQLQKYELT